MSQKRPEIKRPAMRRVPGVGAPASVAPSGGTSAPPRSPTAGPPPGSRPSPGGLLGSIIGGMKKESEKTRAAAPPGGPMTVTKADVMTREERLMQARRDFERTHTERLRRELVESSDPDARIEFPPMEKIWRNIMHELAADLNLHAESVELDVPAAEGDKYVVVYRKPPEVELTEAEELRRARAAAERRARASAGVRKGEALTDQAPVFAPGETGPELTVVGTVKRDLRGVAQTSLDMRKRKREDAERAAENPGEGNQGQGEAGGGGRDGNA